MGIIRELTARSFMSDPGGGPNPGRRQRRRETSGRVRGARHELVERRQRDRRIRAGTLMRQSIADPLMGCLADAANAYAPLGEAFSRTARTSHGYDRRRDDEEADHRRPNGAPRMVPDYIDLSTPAPSPSPCGWAA